MECSVFAAWIGDQTQAGSVVDVFGVEPALGKGNGFAIDDGVVEALLGIGEVVGVGKRVGLGADSCARWRSRVLRARRIFRRLVFVVLAWWAKGS